MPFELSWRPGGSVGFLINLFGFFELTMVVVRGREVLANACLSLRHWPRHFKESVSVIIPKPGKPAYNTPKAFRPIVLLNTLGKLIEKMIARRLQFDAVKYSILHPNQLGGVAQRSTEDAGVFLTHLVRAG